MSAPKQSRFLSKLAGICRDIDALTKDEGIPPGERRAWLELRNSIRSVIREMEAQQRPTNGREVGE